MTSFIPTVNLPILVLINVAGLGLISLGNLFHRSSLSEPSSSTLALGGLGLSLACLYTSYMPIAENQFLHASVPIRVAIAVLAGVRALIAKPEEKTGSLWALCLYDGLGGLLLGWYLGRWDGRVPGY